VSIIFCGNVKQVLEDLKLTTFGGNDFDEPSAGRNGHLQIGKIGIFSRWKKDESGVSRIQNTIRWAGRRVLIR
jgi:hypothetical protein